MASIFFHEKMFFGDEIVPLNGFQYGDGILRYKGTRKRQLER